MATISTLRLVLRPYVPNDWEAFRTLVQDNDLMWRLSGALSWDSARTLFDRLLLHDPATGLVGWAVTAKPANEYCGHVFVHGYDLEKRSADLGFVLLKDFHGRGIAVEAAAAVLEHTRSVLGFRIVRATVDDDNEQSKAVLARIGMSVVARERDSDGWYLVYATPDAG
jgi:ribosomal-protein-alanine N-acetyltransferase